MNISIIILYGIIGLIIWRISEIVDKLDNVLAVQNEILQGKHSKNICDAVYTKDAFCEVKEK